MTLVAAALVFVYDVFAVFYDDGADHRFMRSAYVKVEPLGKAYGLKTPLAADICPSGDGADWCACAYPFTCLAAFAFAVGLADEP